MCECQDGQLCKLHQFIWETRMRAQEITDNPPKLTWRQKLAVWWSCYSPAGVKWDDLLLTLALWVIVFRLLFG
jgi:hypothetical protein